MATNSSILAWRILRSLDGGAWWATVQGGHKELDMNEDRAHTHVFIGKQRVKAGEQAGVVVLTGALIEKIKGSFVK